MNIRKETDYSDLYRALDKLMAKELAQMELYCGIGKAVCSRTEKGAAVMASEYLNKQYPDVKGFSPRSIRRMRDFYRTYENHPTLMYDAVQLGWIQNIVIVDADLTMDLRAWYLKAARQFGWTKAELIEKISSNAHEELVLDIGQEICDNEYKELSSIIAYKTIKDKCILHRKSSWRRRCWGGQKRGVVLWHTMWSPIFTGKRIVFMRC